MVVGGGVGGAAAVVELRREGFDGGITLISAENTVPYERLPLSKEFLLGLPATDGTVEDAAWYEKQEIELLLGVRGTQHNLAARTITFPTAPRSATTDCCSPPACVRASCRASTAKASATCGPSPTPPSSEIASVRRSTSPCSAAGSSK